ncbi:AraC family transcriptional regulator [Hoeflea prorocentri]|uniref:AraC family transcriptional regulator n=1 Tax=Hoeflea prorocentri TaxID=1922333 RepID=A0A9X3UQS6_9HYPH|nr:AraC family transcriptional regulator [Hoeflea prorocentri]MCY6383659.1 AraC family transcriptional regulator [Hoeflea prorocentri]MDA5401459.1 AraC family transcriptional regulator [Hoeflea prorocentri]
MPDRLRGHPFDAQTPHDASESRFTSIWGECACGFGNWLCAIVSFVYVIVSITAAGRNRADNGDSRQWRPWILCAEAGNSQSSGLSNKNPGVPNIDRWFRLQTIEHVKRIGCNFQHNEVKALQEFESGLYVQTAERRITAVDVVSDILNNITARNRVTGLLRLQGDWAFESPEADEAVFHLIFKGSACVTFKGETIRLEEGDMTMFTRGHAHVLGSAPDAPKVTFAENDTRVRMHAVESGEISGVEKQADGPETSIICARFNFSSQTAKNLIETFPDHATLSGLGDETFASFEPMLRRAAAEAHSDQLGALAELDSLVNLLYLSFMRRWLTRSSPEQIGWLKGLHDPQVAKALQAMHESPSRNWSVQELASEVAMSRSTFAARFSRTTGETPLRYLTRWRMILAARQLEMEPNRSINRIALSVGYDSGASFSATFKRLFGKSPGAWRRGLALPEEARKKSA